MADKNISEKLKNARKAIGLSQYDVYNWLGVSQSTFSSWETGKSEPSVSVFLQLCSKYEISDILGFFLDDSVIDRRRILDHRMLSKLADLSDRGRAAVYNCLDFEYANMRHKEAGHLRKIPVYMQPAAAGLGNYLDTPDFETLELDAPENADAGIRISGDSMEPLIHNDEIVFIKFQPQIKGDQIGIFVLNGEAFCKKLEYHGKTPYLCSFNSKYSPILIKPSDSLSVIGRVLL